MRHWEKFLQSDTKHHFGGRQRIYQFPNGYGASVIPEYEILEDELNEEHLDPEDTAKMKAIKGRWEIAVLDGAGELCYETEVTDDVLRHQCDPDVDNILGQISRL
ncbi:hypothetical protein N9H30_00730 [bacterium]|nr:hypothetical protein [bacterium]|tara:strand:- start:1547 stop:1861 length:315 start_codon:yes stop_codon:yes gene_type:complete